jgi:hypothetical protein
VYFGCERRRNGGERGEGEGGEEEEEEQGWYRQMDTQTHTHTHTPAAVATTTKKSKTHTHTHTHTHKIDNKFLVWMCGLCVSACSALLFGLGESVSVYVWMRGVQGIGFAMTTVSALGLLIERSEDITTDIGECVCVCVCECVSVCECVVIWWRRIR